MYCTVARSSSFPLTVQGFRGKNFPTSPIHVLCVTTSFLFFYYLAVSSFLITTLLTSTSLLEDPSHMSITAAGKVVVSEFLFQSPPPRHRFDSWAGQQLPFITVHWLKGIVLFIALFSVCLCQECVEQQEGRTFKISPSSRNTSASRSWDWTPSGTPS